MKLGPSSKNAKAVAVLGTVAGATVVYAWNKALNPVLPPKQPWNDLPAPGSEHTNHRPWKKYGML